MEEIWNHHVRHKEALQRVNVKRNIVILKRVTEGKIEGRTEVKARRGRKREQPPDDFKVTRR